ncbi:LysR family transcriptional regulator [Luteococcus peritonei]|uniref:LysR family transcriptional regulator n=1 Tax=Luteococcus peritonei TaxID=88874 RepID=A0ABW4RVN1_9ACTN
MLEMRRLQILAALEMSTTMTSAAARLHMTPSAVSQQISLLEREVGVPLLDRAGRSVRLNAAGSDLVQHYHLIRAQMEQAEASMARARHEVSGVLTISTFPSFCSTILPAALMSLRRAHPQLVVRVRDMEPLESIVGLREGSVDVAVVDDLQPVPLDDMDVTELSRDEIVLCLSAEHDDLPLRVRLADVAGERWIFDSLDSRFAEMSAQTCREAGFEPEVVAHCGNLTAAMGLVRAGFGITLVSELYLGRETSDVTVRRLNPPITRNHRILTRQSNRDSPGVVAVRSHLRRAARDRYGSADQAPAVAVKHS